MSSYDYQGRTHRVLAFLDGVGARRFGAIAQHIHGARLTRNLRKRLWRLIDHLYLVGAICHDGEGYEITPHGEGILDELDRRAARVFPSRQAA